MRCKEFEAQIDDMLTGIVLPQAHEHLRECPRCTSRYRAHVSVRNSLRQISSRGPMMPSPATDRAVMEGFRRIQAKRAAATAAVPAVSHSKAAPAKLFSFSRRSLAPFWTSRTVWAGTAAAACMVAVLGGTLRLWDHTPTVSAPTVATTAPAKEAAPTKPQQPATAVMASNSVRANRAVTPQQPGKVTHSRTVAPSDEIADPTTTVALGRTRPVRVRQDLMQTASYGDMAVTPVSTNQGVLQLASSGGNARVAQNASSTWAGYENLMYCDPVVCSGPMQVVRMKVPATSVPNAGSAMGNGFVNAEVVVGPDGVARAIRAVQ